MQVFQHEGFTPYAIYLMPHCLWFANPRLSREHLKLNQYSPRWGLDIVSHHFGNMQLSDPPLHKMMLTDKDADAKFIGAENTGFKLAKFTGTPLNLIASEGQLRVVGGEKIAVLRKTVDEISGHEMLGILDLGYEGRAMLV